MPSSVDPSQIQTGPGKLHVDVASAATDLFTNISASLLSSLSAVLAQPLAAPSSVGGITSATDASHTISASEGPFYLGDDPGLNIKDLFRVVRDDNDQEIWDPLSGAYIEVTSFSPGAVGDGFVAGNLTVNFSYFIPAGVTYKIYFGKRATVSALPEGLAAYPAIRRSPDRVAFPVYMRPDDQLAPTTIAHAVNTSTANSYPDPYLAHWKALIFGGPGNSAGFDQLSRGGAIGFVNINGKKNSPDGMDYAFQGHQSAGFLSAYAKGVGASSLSGHVAYTKIDSGQTATVNPTGTNPDLIQLGASDYFYSTFFSPFMKTALHLGVDMLKVAYASGKEEVFIIKSLDGSNNRRATLTTLSGGPANLGGTASVSATWIRPEFFTGGDNESGVSGTLFQGFGHFVPGAISNNPAIEYAQETPFFASGTLDPTRADSARSNWNIVSLRWGSRVESDSVVANIGQRQVLGELWGDGTIKSYGGRISGLPNKPTTNTPVSGSVSVIFNPSTAPFQAFGVSGGSKTITIGFAIAYVPTFGDEMTFQFQFIGTAGSACTIVWPAGFIFSGNDAVIHPEWYDSTTYVVYTFKVVYNGSYYVSRTDSIFVP